MFPYVALGFVILIILIAIFFPTKKKVGLEDLSWIMSDGGKQPFELTGFDKVGNEVLTVKYQPPEELPRCFGDEEKLNAMSVCTNFCDVYRRCTDEVERKNKSE